MPQNHSYEEIRTTAIELLSGRERPAYELTQYEHLRLSIAALFSSREDSPGSLAGHAPRLTPQDDNLFMEVFWDLFRQGVTTIGHDPANKNFPFFRVSHFGKKILDNRDVYFFHDVSTYETLITSQVPKIDATTLRYLKEAMQAFRAGCILSSSVMIGVAAEDTFLRLLETIDGNPKHQPTYAAVQKERSILPKTNKFRAILEKMTDLPSDVREDLDTQFSGIQSVVRTFRNDSGHPTGKIIDREQAYVLLHLFITYAKKMYQLIEYFGQP